VSGNLYAIQNEDVAAKEWKRLFEILINKAWHNNQTRSEQQKRYPLRQDIGNMNNPIEFLSTPKENKRES